MFFVLLRPISWEKWKIAPPFENSPPSNVWICEIGRRHHSQVWWRPFFFGDHLILGEKFWNSAEKSLSILVKTFFFVFFFEITWFWEKNFGIRPKSHSQFWWRPFFFWRSPAFGRKKALSFRAFREIRLNFRTNRLKLLLDQWKFQSRSFAHFSLFQNSPPLFQILATRLQAYRLLFGAWVTEWVGGIVVDVTSCSLRHVWQFADHD